MFSESKASPVEKIGSSWNRRQAISSDHVGARVKRKSGILRFGDPWMSETFEMRFWKSTKSTGWRWSFFI